MSDNGSFGFAQVGAGIRFPAEPRQGRRAEHPATAQPLQLGGPDPQRRGAGKAHHRAEGGALLAGPEQQGAGRHHPGAGSAEDDAGDPAGHELQHGRRGQRAEDAGRRSAAGGAQRAGEAAAATGAARKAAGGAQAAAKGGGGAAAGAAGPVDPMQWWGALTQQFQQIAAGAMQDVVQKNAADTAKNMAAGAGAKDAVKAAKKAPARKTPAAQGPRATK